MTDRDESSLADLSIAAVMSAPEANTSPSTESGTGEDLVEDHESWNNSSSALDRRAPVFSRNMVYSRPHDDDDEVDYSPHSPEPSCEDGIYESHANPAELPTSEFGNKAEAITPTSGTMPTSPHPIFSSSSLSSPHPTAANLESEPEPSPDSPEDLPPPPKVKMTLKDFALRKKRQREAQAMSQTICSSISSPLLEEDEANLVKERPEGLGDRAMGGLRRGSSIIGSNNAQHIINASKGVLAGSMSGSRMGLTVETRSTSRNDTTTPREESCSPSSVPNSSPATPSANGHSRVPLSHNLPNRPPPLLLPPRPVQHPSVSKSNATGTKQEATETIPSLLQRVSGIDRSVSPISPMPSRISQEEEGEIGEILALSRSSKRDADNTPQPFSRNSSQFSHSPPTAPRFHLNPSTSPSSARPSQSSMSPIPSATSNNTNGNRTNLPTAPRALRQSMLQHRSGSGPPTASHSPSLLPCQNNGSGSAFIPRGPLADRDKERERAEWEQRHYRAPPRKGVGSGRGTPWGR